MMRVLIATLSAALAAFGQTTAIRCGRFFDGKRLELQQNVVILVEANRIRAAGVNLTIPAGAKIVDLSRATVMPGLIDCHTHMYLHGIGYEDALLKRSLQYRAILATVAAKKTLLAG